MSSGPARMLKYPGSKWRLADWIISHFPPHTTYLEPFFGSGAVFFTKEPSKVETINDLDGNVVNLFRVIRERPEELAAQVEMTPWAREEYYLSYERPQDPLENARRFLVRYWQGFGSRLGNNAGWKNNIEGRNSGLCVWQSLPERIKVVADRLKGVQIENQPAVQLIERYGFKTVLIYADPPYLWTTRSDRAKGRKLYVHEMTEAEHIELLEALDRHPGPVLLSGYDSRLYNERLRHWVRRKAKATAEKGLARVEVLYLNPVAAAGALQRRLFE